MRHKNKAQYAFILNVKNLDRKSFFLPASLRWRREKLHEKRCRFALSEGERSLKTISNQVPLWLFYILYFIQDFCMTEGGDRPEIVY